MRQLAFGFGSKNGCVCPHSSEHYQIRTIPAVSSLKMRQRSTSAATGTAEPKTSTGVKIDMKERMEFLKQDLDNLFNDKGVDKSQYDDKVNFMDPITKYGSVTGYMFNIKMLKVIFAPEFQLHDIRQTGDLEATTRWTMIMKPTFNKKLGLSRFWDPTLYFTGISVMGVNAETGKFNKHIDEWDALAPENQEFLSREGVSHVFSQLTTPLKTPDLDTPDYKLLKKKRDYEVRRYEPFVVAETSMSSTSGNTPAGQGGGTAFNTLAGYLFGKNETSEKMKMTTPVFSDNGGKMQFVVQARQDGSVRIPEPLGDNVTIREQPGNDFAALIFNGEANDAISSQKVDFLKQQLDRDGIQYDNQNWILARYNDPSTKPRNRRNEVLIPIRNFDIWNS